MPKTSSTRTTKGKVSKNQRAEEARTGENSFLKGYGAQPPKPKPSFPPSPPGPKYRFDAGTWWVRVGRGCYASPRILGEYADQLVSLYGPYPLADMPDEMPLPVGMEWAVCSDVEVTPTESACDDLRVDTDGGMEVVA